VTLSSADDIEEDLEDLYENAPCGYLSLRADGRIAKVNQTFCNWSDYAADELLGRRLHDLLPIAGRIFFETHFSPLLRIQGVFNEVALEIVRKSGERFSVLVNAMERKGSDGQLLFIRLTVFNATDRRLYERELLKARDELKTLTAMLEARIAKADSRQSAADTTLASQQKDAELREQFIAVLGHDLRNPLAAISAGMRLLKKINLDERAETIISMVEKSILRMAGLVDNVLDFARGRLGGGLTLALASLPLEPIHGRLWMSCKALIRNQSLQQTSH
jgi:sigma-B regulation protein RsbU (phosphoserine phosphatase)